jgi:hypothetical protein
MVTTHNCNFDNNDLISDTDNIMHGGDAVDTTHNSDAYSSVHNAEITVHSIDADNAFQYTDIYWQNYSWQRC